MLKSSCLPVPASVYVASHARHTNASLRQPFLRVESTLARQIVMVLKALPSPHPPDLHPLPWSWAQCGLGHRAHRVAWNGADVEALQDHWQHHLHFHQSKVVPDALAWSAEERYVGEFMATGRRFGAEAFGIETFSIGPERGMAMGHIRAEGNSCTGGKVVVPQCVWADERA